MKAKVYDTNEKKAARALSIYGRAPAVLRSMDDKEVAALAALVNDKGEPVDGAREMFDSVLLEHYKATDASKEAPAHDVAKQQQVQLEAAKLLAGGEAAPDEKPKHRKPKPEPKEGE